MCQVSLRSAAGPHAERCPSSVFRALLVEDSTETDSEVRHIIRLSDSQCEYKVHISMFLAYLEGNTPVSSASAWERYLQGTLDFATKYECALIQHAIMRHIWDLVSDPDWQTNKAGRYFAMAAQMSDHALCGDMIRRCLSMAESGGWQGVDPVFGMLDPLQMPEDWAARIPFKYYWALVRVRGSVAELNMKRKRGHSTELLDPRLGLAEYGEQQFYDMLRRSIDG